ncbi:hypothetical protein B0H17DRAFT_1139243 [Mycena rosella]|uniref:Uncharacterized protein n=1 Tax=Mycena rosella TaxID=1033263 RepID=A0AAD7D4M0_MYCRO|nr:hypothetical protein B0H17DRAFT_1139243 [Mycena rosella]
MSEMLSTPQNITRRTTSTDAEATPRASGTAPHSTPRAIRTGLQPGGPGPATRRTLRAAPNVTSRNHSVSPVVAIRGRGVHLTPVFGRNPSPYSLHLIRICPPPIPKIYEVGKLTSTRAIPDVKTLNAAMEDHECLLCVVPLLNMMNDLIEHVTEKYKKIRVDPRDESDTEDWVLNVLWRTALAAYYAAEKKIGVNTTRFGKMPTFPNLTSCQGGGKGAALPDAMLWAYDESLKATVEFKTHGAFIDTTSPVSTATFAHLRGFCNMPLGYGIWVQMVTQKINIAALSNYNSVIFFVRQGQTLFMSGEYTHEDEISLVIFAFLGYALGGIPENILQLPTVHEKLWKLRHFQHSAIYTVEEENEDAFAVKGCKVSFVV